MEIVRWLFIIVVVGLVALFFVSFTLFIRRILINQASRIQHLRRIEEKLDTLIKNQGK